MTSEKYLDAQKAWIRMVDLKVGDLVEVCRAADSREFGWCNSWVKEMDEAIDPENFAIVVGFRGTAGILLNFGGRPFSFPFFVLEKVVDKLPENIKISDSYSVKFKEDKSIEVGCQTIPFELLEKIYETAKGIEP